VAGGERLAAAQRWVQGFVGDCNTMHRHRALRDTLKVPGGETRAIAWKTAWTVV